MSSIKNTILKAQDKKLDLVGVNVISPHIDEAMIEDPVLSVSLGDKTSFIVSFRPIGQQVEELAQFTKDLETSNFGHNVGKEIKQEESLKDKIQIEVESYHYDPFRVSIDFDNPDIDDSTFLLNGVTFKKVSLVESKNGLEVTLKLLFKEHTSDSTSFYSDILGMKLSKRATKRILHELCYGNLTGIPITAILYEDKSHAATLYPITNTIVGHEDNDTYTFSTTTGTIVVNKDEIKSASIKKSKNKDYFIKINMQGIFNIQLHV